MNWINKIKKLGESIKKNIRQKIPNQKRESQSQHGQVVVKVQY